MRAMFFYREKRDKEIRVSREGREKREKEARVSRDEP